MASDGRESLGLLCDICGQQTSASLRTIWELQQLSSVLIESGFPWRLPCMWEFYDTEIVNSSLALRIQQIIAMRTYIFFLKEIIANINYSWNHLCISYHFNFMDFFKNQEILRYNFHPFGFTDFMAVIQRVLMNVQIHLTTIFTVGVQNTTISKGFPLPLCCQHSLLILSHSSQNWNQLVFSHFCLHVWSCVCVLSVGDCFWCLFMLLCSGPYLVLLSSPLCGVPPNWGRRLTWSQFLRNSEFTM